MQQGTGVSSCVHLLDPCSFSAAVVPFSAQPCLLEQPVEKQTVCWLLLLWLDDIYSNISKRQSAIGPVSLIEKQTRLIFLPSLNINNLLGL